MSGTSDILRNARSVLEEDLNDLNDTGAQEDDYNDDNEVTVVSLTRETDGYTCTVQSEVEPPKVLNLSTKQADIQANKIMEETDSPKLKIILPTFDEAETDEDDEQTEKKHVNKQIGDALKQNVEQASFIAKYRNLTISGGGNDQDRSKVVSQGQQPGTTPVNKQQQVAIKTAEPCQRSLRVYECGQNMGGSTPNVRPQNKQKRASNGASRDLHCYESSADMDCEHEYGEALRLPSVSDLNRAIRTTGKVPALDVSPVLPMKVRQNQRSKSQIKIVDVRSIPSEIECGKDPVGLVTSATSSNKDHRDSVLLLTPVSESNRTATTMNNFGKTEVRGMGPVATLPAAQALMELAACSANNGVVMKTPSTTLQGFNTFSRPSNMISVSAPSAAKASPIVSVMQVKPTLSSRPSAPILSLKPGGPILPVASKSASKSWNPAIDLNSKQLFVSKPFKLPAGNAGGSQVFFVNMSPDGKIVALPQQQGLDNKPKESMHADNAQKVNNHNGGPRSEPMHLMPITPFSRNSQTQHSAMTSVSTTVKPISISSSSTIQTPKSVIEVIFSAANSIISSQVTGSTSSCASGSNTTMTFTIPQSVAPLSHQTNKSIFTEGEKLVLSATKSQGPTTSSTMILPKASPSTMGQSPMIRNEPVNAIPGTSMPYRTPGSMKVNRHGNIKRPMNAFMVWARRFRPKLSQQMSNSTNAEISMRLGQVWNQMPESEKNKYYAEAERIKLMHKLTYPDWSYKPKVKKVKNPSQTPSPPGMVARPTMQNSDSFIVSEGHPSNGNDVVRQYTLERPDGSIGMLKGRPPSTTTRTNDADFGPIVSTYSVVHGWKGNGSGPAPAAPVLSETSLATRTLMGINDTPDNQEQAMDLTLTGVNMSEEERRKRIREEIEAVKYEKKPKKPRKSNPKDVPKENPSDKSRRNTPRTRRTKRNSSQVYTTTGSQTECHTAPAAWPFPFSSYPLNDQYAETARAANARNQPLVWDIRPHAGPSVSNSSLPDCDPYRSLIFGNNQRPRVHGLNMQSWVDYMNRPDDKNFGAFCDGAKSESNTSLASCSNIMDNVMNLAEERVNVTKQNAKKAQKSAEKKSAKRVGGKGDQKTSTLTIQAGSTAAQKIMNSMFAQEDNPFLSSAVPNAPELSGSWTNLASSNDVIIDPFDPDQEVAYYGSFADLGFCDVDMTNSNNSSTQDVPFWHYAPYFAAMRRLNPAMFAYYFDPRQSKSTNEMQHLTQNQRMPTIAENEEPTNVNPSKPSTGSANKSTGVDLTVDLIEDESDNINDKNGDDDGTRIEPSQSADADINRADLAAEEITSAKEDAKKTVEKSNEVEKDVDDKNENEGSIQHNPLPDSVGKKNVKNNRNPSDDKENMEPTKTLNLNTATGNGGDDATDDGDEENSAVHEQGAMSITIVEDGIRDLPGSQSEKDDAIQSTDKPAKSVCTHPHNTRKKSSKSKIMLEWIQQEKESLEYSGKEDEPAKKKRGRPRKSQSSTATSPVEATHQEPSKERPSGGLRSASDSNVQPCPFRVPVMPPVDPRRMMVNPFFQRYPGAHFGGIFFPPQTPRRSMMPYTSMPPRMKFFMSRLNGPEEAIDLSLRN